MLLERLEIIKKYSKAPITKKVRRKFRHDEALRTLAKKDSHSLGTKDRHKCHICGMVCSDSRRLRLHLENVHLRTTRMSCDLCPKFFFTKEAIKQHVKAHSKKRFVCNICDYKTARKGHMIRHKQSHDKIISKSQLELDDLVKKGNEGQHWNEPHACTFCQKVFTCRKSLKTHLQSFHLKATEFRCDLCAKFYFSKDSIYDHIKKFHGVKKFKCHVCDYETTHKNHFTRHEAVHGEIVECPVCGKHVVNLNQHLEIHKPKVTCPVCQRKLRREHLNTHLKIHAKKCKNCEEVFKSREDLRRFV